MKTRFLLLAFLLIATMASAQTARQKRRASFAYRGSSRVANKIEDALDIDHSSFRAKNTIVISFEQDRYIKYDGKTDTYTLSACPVIVYVNGKKCFSVPAKYIPEKKGVRNKSSLIDYGNDEAEMIFMSLSSSSIRSNLKPCINYRAVF